MQISSTRPSSLLRLKLPPVSATTSGTAMTASRSSPTLRYTLCSASRTTSVKLLLLLLLRVVEVRLLRKVGQVLLLVVLLLLKVVKVLLLLLLPLVVLLPLL